MGDHCIQHISQSQSWSSRDRNRISDSQIIKFIYICHILVKIVNLIYNKNNRFSRSSQHICNLGIRVHKALLYICNKYNDICRINCNLCLLPHLWENDISAVRLNSSCIDQGKFSVKPVHICINSVSCHTRRILYNGDHLPCQHIKKCGFSYIRTPYNGNYRFTHLILPFSFLIQTDSILRSFTFWLSLFLLVSIPKMAFTKSCPLDFTISIGTCKVSATSSNVK